MNRPIRAAAQQAINVLYNVNPVESEDSESDSGDSASEISDAEVIEDSDSENSDDDGHLVNNLVNEIHLDANRFIAPNGDIWQRRPIAPIVGQVQAHNVIREQQGPTAAVANVCGNSERDAFTVLFTPEIIRKLVTYTNLEGRTQMDLWNDTNYDEMCTFVGLLLLAGVYRAKHENISELWSESDGRKIFNKSMSRNRFCELRRCIRFDDRATRNVRRENDKFAPLRELFDMMVTKFRSSYKAGSNATVDEQLVTFRGRCSFKVFIPSKPGKYGVKLWILADSSTSYCLNIQPYLGRQPGAQPDRGQGQRVVLELTDYMTGSGRHITADNFFSSVELARALLGRRLTYSGTLRKNKPGIPANFLPGRAREPLSTEFGFQNDVTMTSYVPKRNRSVILISTLHRTPDISHEPHHKPMMILDYNSRKAGVDTLDQKVRGYSCKRKTNRWPFALFANLLDIAAHNAFILFISVHPQYNIRKSHRRRIFLINLAKSLLPNRANNDQIRQPPLHPAHQHEPHGPVRPRRANFLRCAFCPRNADKKTSVSCTVCARRICKIHTVVRCQNC